MGGGRGGRRRSASRLSRGANSCVRRGRMVGRSKVWRLASFVDEGRSEVECSLCPVRIKYVGNTTNIARHLELRHPIEFAALDPTAGAGRGAGLGGRHPHRQHQQSREEAAICRILAQHQEELKKQAEGGPEDQQQQKSPPMVVVPAASPCLVATGAPRWSWHTPVQGEYAAQSQCPCHPLPATCSCRACGGFVLVLLVLPGARQPPATSLHSRDARGPCACRPRQAGGRLHDVVLHPVCVMIHFTRWASKLPIS